MCVYQHLPRGANKTLRDVELTPFSNHLAPKLEGPGMFHWNMVEFSPNKLESRVGVAKLAPFVLPGGYSTLVLNQQLENFQTKTLALEP